MTADDRRLLDLCGRKGVYDVFAAEHDLILSLLSLEASKKGRCPQASHAETSTNNNFYRGQLVLRGLKA